MSDLHDLVVFLSNKTHIGRLNADEIREALETAIAAGWSIKKPRPEAKAVDGPHYDAALAAEKAKHAPSIFAPAVTEPPKTSIFAPRADAR